jgi:hypothetical protein
MQRNLVDPIADAELTYQRRSINVRHRWLMSVARIMYWLALVSSIILFWGEFVTSLTTAEVGKVSQILIVSFVILIPITIVVHFGALLQTLAFASNTITREKQTQTWQVLILTNVDARRIVFSKWWATISRMRHFYLGAGLLRAGLTVGAIALLSRHGVNIYGQMFALNSKSILLCGVGLVVLSLSSCGMTSAFGIVASLAGWRGRTEFILAAALRTVMLVALGGVLLLTSQFVPYGIPVDGGQLFRVLSISLIDNGSFLAFKLANNAGQQSLGVITYPICVLICLGFHLLLTLALLSLAELLAVRQGALPPRETSLLNLSAANTDVAD